MPILIEAFTAYYGEEYRNRITYVFNQTIISWKVTHEINRFYNEFLKKAITRSHLEITTKILAALGYDSRKYTGNITQAGEIEVAEQGITIYPGSVENVKDENGKKLDHIMAFLYGERKLFSYDFENDLIYNFYSLSPQEQAAVLVKVFGKDELDDETLDRINEAISLMEEIRENKIGPNRKLYADFALMANHIGAKPKAEVVGSLDNRIFDEENKEHLEKEKDSIDCWQPVFDDDSNEELWLVFFKVLLICDSVFIKLLNGTLLTRCLGFLGEESLLSKYGLSVNDDSKQDIRTNARKLQDILIELSAQEITDIFHSLGGNIFDKWADAYEITSEFEFESYHPLVKGFYEKYKDLLKRVCIGDSREELFTQISKKGFYRYVYFLNRYISGTPANMVIIEKKTKKQIEELLGGLESLDGDDEEPAPKLTYRSPSHPKKKKKRK